MRIVALALCAVACGGANPTATTGANAAGASPSGWRASSVTDASALRVRINPDEPWKEVASAIIGDMCADAILVWGDLQVDDSLRPRAILIAVDEGKPVLGGFLICNAYMEAFLKLQTTNPRLKAGHGGSADLKWHDGGFFMRRRWSAADIALGRLSPPPSDVFQKGETLAALVSCEDPRAPPADVLAALARVPSVFLFGMFPLK